MTNMVCAACILGISIGIGGVFLYRVLRLWLHQSSDSKHLSVTSDNRARQKVDRADCSSEAEEETASNSSNTPAACSPCDDVSPHSSSRVAEIVADSGVRHRSSQSLTGSHTDSCESSHSSLHSLKTAPADCDTEPVRVQNSLSTLDSGCSPETSRQITDSSRCMESALYSECNGSLLFPDARNVSMENASFHHSTPEDPMTAASVLNSSDSPSKDDGDTSLFARNALSWHDSMNVEPTSSRSCISLDDSLFLRDLNGNGVDEAEVFETCTAVSSLEQLEQEVARVVSDCGDMERCFGMLRRRDSLKAVVSRYSLGVADCVLATDSCSCWQESTDSPYIDEPSLSSSVGIVWHSGFLWDDDEFYVDSPNAGFVPVAYRATRSLSPLPAVQRQQANCRASLGVYADSRVSQNLMSLMDSDKMSSAELAPCSVYDVNRRLSGRLPV